MLRIPHKFDKDQQYGGQEYVNYLVVPSKRVGGWEVESRTEGSTSFMKLRHIARSKYFRRSTKDSTDRPTEINQN